MSLFLCLYSDAVVFYLVFLLRQNHLCPFYYRIKRKEKRHLLITKAGRFLTVSASLVWFSGIFIVVWLRPKEKIVSDITLLFFVLKLSSLVFLGLQTIFSFYPWCLSEVKQHFIIFCKLIYTSCEICRFFQFWFELTGLYLAETSHIYREGLISLWTLTSRHYFTTDLCLCRPTFPHFSTRTRLRKIFVPAHIGNTRTGRDQKLFFFLVFHNPAALNAELETWGFWVGVLSGSRVRQIQMGLLR